MNPLSSRIGSAIGIVKRWSLPWPVRIVPSRPCSVMAGLLLALFVARTGSAEIVTATKTRNADGTYSATGGDAVIAIATGQLIRWAADYTPFLPTEGRGFYLHTSPTDLTAFPLSTSLPNGHSEGTFFLSPGNYRITVNLGVVGPGTYTIFYNLTAGLTASPASRSFGVHLAGTDAPATVSIGAATGSEPMTISSVTSSDAHFSAVTRGFVGASVPPTRTLNLRFHPGSAAGLFNGTITVAGTSAVGNVQTTIEVTGETRLPEPNITCPASVSLGSADWSSGESPVFSASFSNHGTGALHPTSITLAPGSDPSFALNGIPSLAAVPAAGSRTVAIRFTPTAEGTFNGNLRIASDDPDEGVKTCAFQARGHHPVPRMRLASTLLDYRQVELGFTFTKAIEVFNDGDAPLTVAVTDLSSGPALTQWPERDLNPGIAIPPASVPHLFLMRYRPTTLGSETIGIRVSGNDPTLPSQDVTLLGEGIAPVPIDSVLVLDRSGSMAETAGSRRKIDALQTASSLYLDLQRRDTGSGTGDRLGLVRYNHVNDVYSGLDFLEATETPGSHIAEAHDKLSPAAVADPGRLAPSGATGIGSAMQTAAGLLPGSAGGRKQVMVVLTDGQETDPPWIADVLGGVRSGHPDMSMYSVGLGADIEPTKLQAITNVMNGYHQVADALDGPSRYDLETFYFKIFSHATGMSLVIDPTFGIHLGAGSGSGPITVATARIVSSDRSATFLVLDEQALRPFYTLELVDPFGGVVDLGSSVAGVPVQVLRRFDYTLYRVTFPAAEDAASYVGDWQLRIRLRPAASPDSPSAAVRGASSNFPDDGFIKAGLVPVGFAAAVGSDYRLEVDVVPSHFLPGAAVTLTAALTDRGWPAPDGKVKVDVTTPFGRRIAGVPLFDDGTHGDPTPGDSRWTASFHDTLEPGSYRFLFHSAGHNQRGELAPREESRYLTLSLPFLEPGKPPGGGTGPKVGRNGLFSFHVGSTHPLGTLQETADANIHARLDFGWQLQDRLRLLAMAGLSQLTARSGESENPRWLNASLNLQALIPTSTGLRYYLEAGPGFYEPRIGAGQWGFNVGTGAQIPLAAPFLLELGADYHQPQAGTRFFTFQLGILFR